MRDGGRGGLAALKMAVVLVGLGGASVAYPLLLGASALIGVVSLRAALGAAVLAVMSAVLVVWQYRGDEPLGNLLWFAVVIALSGLVQTLLTGIGTMFEGERVPR